MARQVQTAFAYRHAAERYGAVMSQANRTKGDGQVRTKKLVELVQREIDDGATSVEEIHKAIANLPLDVLERLDSFEAMVKGLF
jgi:hypothetical protein